MEVLPIVQEPSDGAGVGAGPVGRTAGAAGDPIMVDQAVADKAKRQWHVRRLAHPGTAETVELRELDV